MNSKMYKTISNSDISKTGISLTKHYYYCCDGEIKEIIEQRLENNNNEKQFQLFDEDYEWNPKINSIYLDLTVSFQNTSILFGENGSCYDDSILGVGLSWKAEKSKIKKCIKIGSINSRKNNYHFEVKSIELENISSNTPFRLFLYIEKPSAVKTNSFFGNEQGLVLFDEIMWTLIMEGDGSIFPIFEIENEGGPLWTYSCNVDDIEEDQFDENNISININRKHPLYETIHPKSPVFSNLVLNEMMSNAITLIIMSIRASQQNNIVDLNRDCERGSILQALKYFHDRLNIDINGEYNDVQKSVKKFFDKEC